jgi:aldehyde:ferredoxin oxidoreductase
MRLNTESYSKLLHIDLTTGKTWTEPTENYRKFIGARGLNIGLLFKLLKPAVDPLSPENMLIFSTGPVTGTLAPSSARYTVTAKSPLTGFMGDANSGGFWSSELRYAGYDGILFYGKSEKPVYLLIKDSNVRLLDASDIWGKDTWETTNLLKEKHGEPQLKVACIGIAGENLVKFASIMNDYIRTAGRTGIGAVMGSKNLKAIAVRGTQVVKVAQPERFYQACKRMRDTILNSRQFELYHLSGVIGHRGVEDLTDDGALSKLIPPSVVKLWAEVGGKEWWKTHWTKLKACSACHMHCSHFYIVRAGPFAGIMSEGPEAETMGRLTFLLGHSRKDLAAYANVLLNRVGLDAIEMTTAIGALITWREKGVITDKQLKELGAGWLRPNWGDLATILSLIQMTAKREGIGNLIAEGVYNLSQKIGAEAEYWAGGFVKGMPAGGRISQKGGLLNHMVSNRGPDHLRGSPSLEYYGHTGEERIKEDWVKYVAEPELFQSACQFTSYDGKAALVIWQEHLRCLSDSFGLCSFNYGNWPNTFIYPEDFAELYSSATGVEMTGEDVLKAAHRIINVEKAFNIREGWTRKDDQPPENMVKEVVKYGPYKGDRVHLEKFNKMLDEYYTRRGWDEKSGLPTRDKLEELDLADVANELERMGKLV